MVVTGATGLVGGAIVLELLRRFPERPIHCIVRGESESAACDRLHRSLRQAAALYEFELPVQALEESCHAVVGDVTEAGCGVEAGWLPEVDEVWHCAASLKFADADREEIEAHNVAGTANVVALAERLGVSRFNHVSTAYVVGDRNGAVPEEAVRADRVPNNVYEETKGRAEKIVEGADLDLVRILRPSIVVGHSRTARCASNTGIYGFVDQMQRFRREVSKRLGDYLTHRSIALIGKPETRLNLIPIDAVAAVTLELSESDAPAGIYHLASLDPPTLGESLSALMEVLEMCEPRYVEREQQLNSIDASFNRGASFHRAYLLQDKDFGCARTLEHCSSELLTTGLDAERLTTFARVYLGLAGRREGAGPMAAVAPPGGGQP